MNEDMDIRSYIMEVAPKSGQNAKVWQRVADALTRFGVRTMAELEKTDDGALYRLFLEDRRGLGITQRVKYQYATAVHMAGLLDTGEDLIHVYFSEHAPSELAAGMLMRAVNALHRAGIDTMSALCAAPVERLSKIRNIGDKSLELVVMMRRQYMLREEGST